MGKIVTNLSLKRLNQLKNFTLDPLAEHHISDISSEEYFLVSETKDMVHQALLRLPIGYRTTIVLRDIQGYSYNEISGILGITLGTVKSRINQGRILLADLLKDAQEEG